MGRNQLIKKCLFPAAGYGTRFLPATKAVPKEMLPILTKPLLQYGVEEALSAGINPINVPNVIIVVNAPKTINRGTVGFVNGKSSKLAVPIFIKKSNIDPTIIPIPNINNPVVGSIASIKKAASPIVAVNTATKEPKEIRP